MEIILYPNEVQARVQKWRAKGKTVALVPTMGALHEGHLNLVRKAATLADKVVASIFVNPLQFRPEEDFEAYPRTLYADKERLAELKVDLLFSPLKKHLYPEGFQTHVQTGALTKNLCGQSRPGSFDGVATVCLKLFSIAQPDFAVFGEKDYQQLRVVQQMVADYHLPIQVVGEKTAREPDGLALSSRNRYLSGAQREVASRLYQSMRMAQQKVEAEPDREISEIEKEMGDYLDHPEIQIDYLHIVDSLDLEIQPPKTKLTSLAQPRVFIAAKIGKARLIDNAPLRTSS